MTSIRRPAYAPVRQVRAHFTGDAGTVAGVTGRVTDIAILPAM
jgi:hypothetical protein